MNLAVCFEDLLPARGGCEIYITDLVRRLVADRHEVHLYACSWDPSALPAGLHVHAVRRRRGPRFLRPWAFSAACGEARRAARHDLSIGFDKTTGVDLVYALGGLHAASAENNLLKHRTPLARGLAGLGKRLSPAHWSFAWLERRQYLGSPRPLIVVNSRMVRDHFHRHLGVAPGDVRVVHGAIDPARFADHDRGERRIRLRRQWSLGPDDVVAAFVGMNYRLKGLGPLLRALRVLPPSAGLRLLVAGSPRTDPYRRLAERLGVADRVRFLGYCRDPRDCYFAADLLVHPTFYDPCSNVVLEAMACGLPVVTTRHNGASELMHPPREGYVLDDPHDHAALAACLGRLLDPGKRAACAEAARRSAAAWTFEHHYRRLLEAFAAAATHNRGRAAA
jgi:UDP-glucose:(heptosyl)LPS alpha-1,3-glucosyltransferase